jgi:hypothetical protein
MIGTAAGSPSRPWPKLGREQERELHTAAGPVYALCRSINDVQAALARSGVPIAATVGV